MPQIVYDAAELQALAAALAPYLPSAPPHDVGISPPPPPLTPPPPGNVGGTQSNPALARFLGAPSDWARWTDDNWLGSSGGGYQAKEYDAILAHLMAKYGWDDASTRTRISQQLNAYNSTIKLAGAYDPKTGVYKFIKYIVGFPFAQVDSNGAADAYIAAQFPNVVPGPLA